MNKQLKRDHKRCRIAKFERLIFEKERRTSLEGEGEGVHQLANGDLA